MSEMAFVAMCTREDARIYMTEFLRNRHGIPLLPKELSCLLPDPGEDFAPRRQSALTSNGMQEKTFF